MEKILPPTRNPFAGVPVLTPEQTRDLLIANNTMMARINELEHKFGSIQVILACAIFRAKEMITDNMVTAPGRSALNLVLPLEHLISQKQIDAIEHMFPGDAPAVIFKAEKILGQDWLRVCLVPLQEAEETSRTTLN